MQLDVYGELIDAFHQSRMAELELDDGSWALECAVLEHLAEVWDQPDHGIWERRGDGRHYVFSKVMTWVAFDRGIKSAEKFGLEAPLERWRGLRDTIYRDVCENGFDVSQTVSSSPMARNCSMPASCCCRRWAFCRHRTRASRHIAAIENHMMRDGFVLRHDPREVSEESSRSKARSSPAAYGSPTPMCWRATSHKAQALFDRVVGVANDLGLLAEEFDSGEGRQTGNFPQALTHIALINTAHNLMRRQEAGREAGGAAVEIIAPEVGVCLRERNLRLAQSLIAKTRIWRPDGPPVCRGISCVLAGLSGDSRGP